MVFQKILIVLGIVFLCSCGREPVLDVGEWGGYVDLYQQEAAKYGNPVEIKDLKIRETQFKNPSIWGLCTLTDGETPLVELSSDKLDMLHEYIDYLGEETVQAMIESLMFHELGHCIGGLAHGTAEIMNETMLDSGYYMYYRDDLIAEEMTVAHHHDAHNRLLAKVDIAGKAMEALTSANPLQVLLPAIAPAAKTTEVHNHEECSHN